jgi:hypothetical protein
VFLESAGIRESLKAIIVNDLPGRGLVAVISLRGVAEQLGDRWSAKREAIWDHLERSVRRHARQAYCVQINEADFLVGLSEGGPGAVTRVGLDALRDVQTFFLGHERDSRAFVRLIRSLNECIDDGEGERSDTAAALAIRAHASGSCPPRASLDHPSGPSGQAVLIDADPDQSARHRHRLMTSATPLLTELDRKVRPLPAVELAHAMLPAVTFGLRPVWSLKHGAVSSFRLARRFAQQELDDRQREEADLFTVAHLLGPDVLGRMKAGAHMHLPVTLSTLLLQRSRLRLLSAISEARVLLQTRVLLEIERVEAGVVPGRLLESLNAVRPFFRLMLADEPDRTVGGSTLKNVGFSGVVLDLSTRPCDRLQALQRVRQARKLSSVVVVHGVAEADLTDRTWVEAGASHASTQSTRSEREAQALEATDDRATMMRVLRSIDSQEGG